MRASALVMSSMVWRAVAESARSRSRSTLTVSPSPDSSSNWVSPGSRSFARASASACSSSAWRGVRELLEELDPQALQRARGDGGAAVAAGHDLRADRPARRGLRRHRGLQRLRGLGAALAGFAPWRPSRALAASRPWRRFAGLAALAGAFAAAFAPAPSSPVPWRSCSPSRPGSWSRPWPPSSDGLAPWPSARLRRLGGPPRLGGRLGRRLAGFVSCSSCSATSRRPCPPWPSSSPCLARAGACGRCGLRRVPLAMGIVPSLRRPPHGRVPA